VIVELDMDVLSWFDRKSEKIALYLEPIATGQHQLFGIWKLCAGILPLGLSIVAKNRGGCADRSEPIVAEDISAEKMI
jgi:hypothetical protein